MERSNNHPAVVFGKVRFDGVSSVNLMDLVGAKGKVGAGAGAE